MQGRETNATDAKYDNNQRFIYFPYMAPPTTAGGRVDERNGSGGGPERGGNSNSGGGSSRGIVHVGPAAELTRPAAKGGEEVLPSAAPVFCAGHNNKLGPRPGRKPRNRVLEARSSSPPPLCDLAIN